MISVVRLVCISVALSGCLPTNPSEQADLRRNRALWDAQQPARHEFVLQRSGCECLPEWTVPLKVVVHGGQIQSVTSLRSSEEVSAATHRALSIDDLFAQIESAVDRGAYRVEVMYDRELGYPTSVFIDDDEQMVDDEVAFTVADLRAVN